MGVSDRIMTDSAIFCFYTKTAIAAWRVGVFCTYVWRNSRLGMPMSLRSVLVYVDLAGVWHGASQTLNHTLTSSLMESCHPDFLF